MQSNDSLMLYTKLAGFRLAVIADRCCCGDAVYRNLHDRLIDGLDAAINQVRNIMALERRLLDGNDEIAAHQFVGEREIFGRIVIDLLDEIEIDYDTKEYRLNGGRWTSASLVDDGGIHVGYPHMVPLGDGELGSLAPIIRAIRMETGIAVQASWVEDGEIRRLHPKFPARSLHRA